MRRCDLRVGAGIYEHTDGRWEARYRKGRKPDGTIIYGSVYGKTYKEAERKRAELLNELALKAENGDSEEAAAISESNKSIRDFYAVVPQGKTSYPAPLTDSEVEELIPYIRKCYPGLRLSICLALYMGVASEALAALRYSDFDLDRGTLTVSNVMIDAKHMFGTVVPCEKRTLPIPKVIFDFIDLPHYVREKNDGYVLTENGERIKTLRSEKILWSRTMTACGYEGKITPEILRATFIRRAFERGLNFETVSRITGITVLTLRSKYGHYSAANPALIDAAFDSSAGAANAKQMNLLILGAGSPAEPERGCERTALLCRRSQACAYIVHADLVDILIGVVDHREQCRQHLRYFISYCAEPLRQNSACACRCKAHCAVGIGVK